MKNVFCLAALFFVFISLGAATWTVALYDAYGDGWNGGTLSVYVNGAEILSGVTLASGYGPANYSISINHGDRITTVYTPAGWAYENEYRIINEQNVAVKTSGGLYVQPTSIVNPFMATVLTPQTSQIGTGTTIGYLPIYPFYGYSYTQSIYLNSEMPVSPYIRRISKIKYYWNGVASASHSINWTVYMGHTTLTSFATTTSWVPLSGLTQVFSGNVHLLATAGWVEITLDKPFEYDGTSNLVMAVDENTDLYDSSGGRFFETAVTGNRSLYYYNDMNNPNPASPPSGFTRAYVPNIIFQTDPIVYPPKTENFSAATVPMGWSQYFDGGIPFGRWSATNTANAGGTPYELRADWYSGTGVSRLISPPIKTTGINRLDVSFKHYFMDYGTGLVFKLQYSNDMNTWTDTGWTFNSGGGSFGGTVNLTVSGLATDYTYLAWTIEGNHYNFDFWYLDDVIVNIPLVEVHPVSIDIAEAIGASTFTPLATVYNSGESNATFYVTFTIGNTTYTNTQLVADLVPGVSRQITFAAFTPYVHNYTFSKVTTHLASDQNPANDQLTKKYACLTLNKQVYADANNSNLALDGPSTFNLSTPGTVTRLGTSSVPGLFIAGADWFSNQWYGTEYDNGLLTNDNYWQINHITGNLTLLGRTGVPIHGIAYDKTNDILYGTDLANLYRLNRETGHATLIGSHVNATTMIGIAYAFYTGVLYGVDLVTNNLYWINTSTGYATMVGPLGIDINYGQDLAYDLETDDLFLTGYTVSPTYGPALFNIHQYSGTAYKVGDFPGDYQMVGFAIPYFDPVPDVHILANSTLSWQAIPGATEYRIYGSNYATGTFSWMGSTPSLNWVEPGFPRTKRFYKVSAIYTPAKVANPVPRTITEFKDPLTGELLDPQPEPVIPDVIPFRSLEPSSAGLAPGIMNK